VLDVMLPDGSGLDVCRDLRAQRSNVPIILLTALKEDVDRIIGLEIGADDYLGKPFNPRELIARVRAVLRRHGEAASSASDEKVYRFEGFTADPQTRRVIDPQGADIVLTGAEFDLLKTFLDRPGRVLSRDQLLDLTRGRNGDVFDRSIDVLVSRLRRKLGDRASSRCSRRCAMAAINWRRGSIFRTAPREHAPRQDRDSAGRGDRIGGRHYHLGDARHAWAAGA
jgi:two-component system phosphate regulon response regulator OmpR